LIRAAIPAGSAALVPDSVSGRLMSCPSRLQSRTVAPQEYFAGFPSPRESGGIR
jgi:hypothetical protein